MIPVGLIMSREVSFKVAENFGKVVERDCHIFHAPVGEAKHEIDREAGYSHL